MSVAFYRGQQLGAEDLNIYLDNSSGHPTNAAEITYALYDFTTGLEVLLGVPHRTPVNPSVGHYYASIIIPLDANIGSYRVRWTFRELVGGPVHQVVQEFEVIDKATNLVTLYSDCETDMMRRLRILLRDNCLGGEEEIELDVDGGKMIVSLRELFETIHGTDTPS
jgi:hypothetical protein